MDMYRQDSIESNGMRLMGIISKLEVASIFAEWKLKILFRVKS